MRFRGLFATAVLGTLGVGPYWVHAQAKVDQQPAGPAGSNTKYAVSVKSVHVACAGPKGSRYAVTVDGVVGPQFDEIIPATGIAVAAVPLQPDMRGEVVFSDDGGRYAYVGRDEEQFVVIVDNKELCRIPTALTELEYLALSPGNGAHVFFHTRSTNNTAPSHEYIDGQPAPDIVEIHYPVFSADGGHWAYNGAEQGKPPTLFLDGKPAGYNGWQPTFTSDGHLLSFATDPKGTNQLLVDGKPALQARFLDKSLLKTAPTGGHWAVQGNTTDIKSDMLWIDGNLADGAGSLNQFLFSPDGKHYAGFGSSTVGSRAHCWMFVDGKKHHDYMGVSSPYFSPDSAHLTYMGRNEKQFLVTDGQESDGYDDISVPVFGTNGHIGAIVRQGGQMSVLVDGKASPPVRFIMPGSLSFSPDGSRYAYAGGDSPAALAVLTNSTESTGAGGAAAFNNVYGTNSATYYLFSPDSKHLICCGSSTGHPNLLFLDGQPIPVNGIIGRANFTSDSKHLVWTCAEQGDNHRTAWKLYADGKPLASFDHSNFEMTPNTWQVADDGTLTFAGLTGNAITRFKVTPAADSDLASILADVQTAEAKAEADKKAAADQAAAAKAQAAADAKAKADAAADARAKAKADAAAARAKAAADRAAQRLKGK